MPTTPRGPDARSPVLATSVSYTGECTVLDINAITEKNEGQYEARGYIVTATSRDDAKRLLQAKIFEEDTRRHIAANMK